VINFLRLIFTWWNRQTIGTFVYTFFLGKKVGSDEHGNKYYSSSKNKRWVIYKDNVESSKIPTEWYSWIHFLSKDIPSDKEQRYSWQKQRKENLTGTKEAYKPDGSLSRNSKKDTKKYDTWKI
jgi:NADH:ubiquinone oxidoreductase subunit